MNTFTPSTASTRDDTAAAPSRTARIAGLIVSGLGRGGLLLPQVPTEYGWSSREFLDQTCVKAGLPPGCWKRSDVAVQTFEGQIFEEKAV